MNDFRDRLDDDPIPLEGAGPQVDIADAALHAVARFPFTIIGCTVLGACAGVVVALSKPNEYTSTAALLLRLGARELLTPEAAIDSEASVRGVGVRSEDQVLMWKDPALALRVAGAVGPARILKRYDPSEFDSASTPLMTRGLHRLQQWIFDRMYGPQRPFDDQVTPTMERDAAAVVAARVDVMAARNSSTVAVEFTSYDPELARDIVNAYVEVIQQRNLEIFQTAPQREFVRQKFMEAETQAQHATNALRSRQLEDGVYDVAGMIALNSHSIQVLQGAQQTDNIQLRAVDKQLALVAHEMEEQQKLLAPAIADANTPAAQEPVVIVHPAAPVGQDPKLSFRYTLLREELRQVLDQLEQISLKYSEDSPLVSVDIARLRKRRGQIESDLGVMEREQAELDAARENAREAAKRAPAPPILIAEAGSNSPLPPDPLLANLQFRRITLDQEKLALNEGLDARGQLIALHEQRNRELLQLEPIHADLAKAVVSADRRLTELSEARVRIETLEEISADERMRSIVVTQAATLPLGKNGPNRAKLVAVGVFGGLLVGAATALLRQLLDSRLRYPKNVERALGIPVLGVVPEERRWRLDSRKIVATRGKIAQ